MPQDTQAPNQPAGQQRNQQKQGGRRPKPKSRYGTQMAEKQQLKEIYGVSENQLRNYYKEARRVRSATGDYLVRLLEQRLDNAVFRAGFAVTRPTSRQMVSHGFFQVNGRGTNVASYQLKPGDIVTIKPTKRGKAHFVNFPKSLQNVTLPSWLSLDHEQYSFKVSGMPSAEEAMTGADIQAIVEFFAR